MKRKKELANHKVVESQDFCVSGRDNRLHCDQEQMLPWQQQIIEMISKNFQYVNDFCENNANRNAACLLIEKLKRKILIIIRETMLAIHLTCSCQNMRLSKETYDKLQYGWWRLDWIQIPDKDWQNTLPLNLKHKLSRASQQLREKVGLKHFQIAECPQSRVWVGARIGPSLKWYWYCTWWFCHGT